MKKINNNSFISLIKTALLFFFMYYIVSVVAFSLKRFIPNIDFKDTNIISLIDLGVSIIELIVIVFVFRKLLKRDFLKLKELKKKKQLRNFFEDIFVSFIVMMVIKVMCSQIEMIIGSLFNLKSVVIDNQNIIEELFKNNKISIIISACILAPITEELVFRGSIRKTLTNKRLFIIFSGLLFGLLHIVTNPLILLEILIIGYIINYYITSKKSDRLWFTVVSLLIVISFFYGIYVIDYGNIFLVIKNIDLKEIVGSIGYIAMGSYIAYVYVKSDNIFASIGVHALNNIFSILLMFLMTLF